MAAPTVVNDAIPAVSPWSCDEVLPARPFGSQMEAVDTANEYGNSQDFAVSIIRSNARGTKRVSLCCTERDTRLLATGNITTVP